MKKLFACILSLARLTSLLTGCGKQGEASTSGAESGAASVENEPLGTVELSTVTDICTYLCGLPADTVVCLMGPFVFGNSSNEDIYAAAVAYFKALTE